jgi:hypothetical protein
MTNAPALQTLEPKARSRPQLPNWHVVLMEHLRRIGFGLRIPMVIAAVFAVLATIVLAIQIVDGDMAGNFYARPSALPGGIGALLAVAVWAREERFGPGFLWTLPVDRSRHALTRVLAGWLWLMGGVLLFQLALLVLALVSGDGVLPTETLNVLTTDVPRSVPVDPATLRKVQWTPGPLVWAVPFGGATATYLFASAFMLGIRHPLRWVVGAVLAFPVSSFLTHMASRLSGAGWLADAPERALTLLCEGRYGFDSLLKLRTWTLDRRAALTTGERIEVWSAVPDIGDWGIATLIWTLAGLVALLAAASRHREQRRG